MRKEVIKQGLKAYLKAAEQNLKGYIEDGTDERAIRAGRKMVEDFKREIAKWEN